MVRYSPDTGSPDSGSRKISKLSGSLGSKTDIFCWMALVEGRTQFVRTPRSDLNLQKKLAVMPSITVWLSDWSTRTASHHHIWVKLCNTTKRYISVTTVTSVTTKATRATKATLETATTATSTIKTLDCLHILNNWLKKMWIGKNCKQGRCLWISSKLCASLLSNKGSRKDWIVHQYESVFKKVESFMVSLSRVS